MQSHPAYPNACVLCCYFMLPEDAQPARYYSPGIGHICEDCNAHVIHGLMGLFHAPRIGFWMIPDGDRNNTRPPRITSGKKKGKK
jgi:hypothetical protein